MTITRDSLGRVRRPEQNATQFQPLDQSSPTALVQVKMTEALRDELDVAAQERGLSRSAAIREALVAWMARDGE